MLIYFGVTPYLVFDGDNLPSKSGTESERRKRRDESKKLGLDLYRKGRIAEAQQELQKAIDVTPYMARQLIEELKQMKIQYVVAPYEADAQLAYLERQGMINGIISEDSDLLVFGAKRLITKLDQHGECVEINRSDFTACRDISLIGWTDADFRRMCILSGCDYLPSIPKMGLKTAYRYVRKYKNVEKVLRMLQFEGKYHIPADYLDNFKQAELTFLYQRVFCPKEGKLVTLTTLEDGIKVEEMPFIGADVDPETAVGVACGDLDPMTKQPINLKQSTAGRLTTGVTRRKTISSTADLKPSKPISSFFTPKRVPLAELDPNSFTPSPSQQRLLERHANNSWEPSPAPAQPGVTRSASSLRLSLPGGGPMVRSAERESFLARAARMSTFQSAKRQRLCSDADEESPPDPKESRSRFFASTDEPSPSGRIMTRSKKPRKSSLGVFSDEVAEEIMSQLADVGASVDSPKEATSGAPGTNGSGDNALPAKSPNPSNDSETRQENGQDSQTTVSTEPSDDSSAAQDSMSQTTPTTSVSADSDPELFNQVLEFHVQKQNSALLSKYAFQGNANSTSSASKGVSAKKPTVGQNPGLKSSNSSRAGTSGEPLRRPRLTPLQRLGQSAMAKSRSMERLGARTPVPGTRDSGYESDFAAGRSSMPMPAPKHQGSEDLLVPNSDDEDADPRECERPKAASLDLQRFCFTPK